MFEKNNSSFRAKAKNFFRILRDNRISVSGSKEYFSIPLIVFAIVAFVFSEICIPALLIAFFCGIRFTISGPDFIDSKVIEYNL